MRILKCISLIIITTIYLSCKQSAKNTLTDELEAKFETIKIFAQKRPFSEPEEFEMPVLKTKVKLEYADTSHVMLNKTDLVLGLPSNTPIAIPLKYLTAYEVANLSLANEDMTVTWCPIVGTARVFDAESVEDNSGFDFGMALKNNNLIIVDRKTRTAWNQLSGKAIKGELEGKRLHTKATIQSTWDFWKNKYPDTKLLIVKDTFGLVVIIFLVSLVLEIQMKEKNLLE